MSGYVATWSGSGDTPSTTRRPPSVSPSTNCDDEPVEAVAKTTWDRPGSEGLLADGAEAGTYELPTTA